VLGCNLLSMSVCNVCIGIWSHSHGSEGRMFCHQISAHSNSVIIESPGLFISAEIAACVTMELAPVKACSTQECVEPR